MINDFKHGLVVKLPKKKGTMKYEELKTKHFISHTSKILCRIIRYE